MAGYFDPERLKDIRPLNPDSQGAVFFPHVNGAIFKARRILANRTEDEVLEAAYELDAMIDWFFQDEKREGIERMKCDPGYAHLFEWDRVDSGGGERRQWVCVGYAVPEDELLAEGNIPTEETWALADAVEGVLETHVSWQEFYSGDESTIRSREMAWWAVAALTCAADSIWRSINRPADASTLSAWGGQIPDSLGFKVPGTEIWRIKANHLKAGILALDAMECIHRADILQMQETHDKTMAARTQIEHERIKSEAAKAAKEQRNEMARAGARAKHAAKAMAIEAALSFYCEHRERYSSKSEAAQDIAEKSDMLFGQKIAFDTLRKKLQGLDCASKNQPERGIT